MGGDQLGIDQSCDALILRFGINARHECQASAIGVKAITWLMKRLLAVDGAPIVGVTADPENAGCVLVGTSLAHLSIRRGEVFRACGSDLMLSFRDPLPVEPLSIVNRPGQSWPFDSFIATPDGWMAVGQNRFVRFRDGEVKIDEVPELHAWAGLQVSEPRDGHIFIEAACCWGSDAFVQYRVMALPIMN